MPSGSSLRSSTNTQPVIRLEIPKVVQLEILRFLALLPLARMDFRTIPSAVVTASDASTSGGGVTVSRGLSNLGQMAASCQVRGDVPALEDMTQVLTIGLFDGIGALRVAADSAGLPIAGHISVEMDSMASPGPGGQVSWHDLCEICRRSGCRYGKGVVMSLYTSGSGFIGGWASLSRGQ